MTHELSYTHYLVPSEADRYLIAALLNRIIETEAKDTSTIDILKELVDVANRIFVAGSFTGYRDNFESHGNALAESFSSIVLISSKIDIKKIISMMGHAFLQAIESIGGSLRATGANSEFCSMFEDATNIVSQMIRTNLISQVSLNDLNKGNNYANELRNVLEIQNRRLYEIAKNEPNDSTVVVIAYTRLRLFTQALTEIIFW